MHQAAQMQATHLVACGADALLNDHMVHRLIIYTQDEGGSVILVVGGLAVSQAGSALHAAGRVCTGETLLTDDQTQPGFESRHCRARLRSLCY